MAQKMLKNASRAQKSAELRRADLPIVRSTAGMGRIHHHRRRGVPEVDASGRASLGRFALTSMTMPVPFFSRLVGVTTLVGNCLRATACIMGPSEVSPDGTLHRRCSAACSGFETCLRHGERRL